METEEEGIGAGVVRTSPIEIARPTVKNITHPVLCQWCEGEYHIQEDGPDAGRLFTCGIMVENLENGVRVFACPYFKSVKAAVQSVEDKRFCKTPEKVCMCQPEYDVGSCGKPLAEVIDSDRANAALRIVAILKARPSGKRPVIVAEEPAPGYTEPSPHPFMDPVIKKLQQVVR